mgnify:CR=1 FL=1
MAVPPVSSTAPQILMVPSELPDTSVLSDGNTTAFTGPS